MRIAIDVTPLHDPHTGVGVVTSQLLGHLAERDDIDLVAYSASWRGRGTVAALVPDGVAVVHRPMAARPLRQAWRRADVPPIEWFTGPVDVVFGTNFVVPPARRAGRVALVHDLTAWRFPELCTDDTRQYPDLVGRAVATGAHVITPTRAVGAEVIETLGADPDRVHPVHWGPAPGDPGSAERGRNHAGGDRYVLALGTIEPRKDHPTLVEAFDRLAATDPRLRLVVAGPDGWGVDRYEAAVGAASHAERIVRLGWVNDGDRADLLAGATVFAYPSVYEGFGLPPLEAMAAGVPVVATAIPALEEVLGDAAVLVAPGDAAALAAGLAAALDGPDRAAAVAAGRIHAAALLLGPGRRRCRRRPRGRRGRPGHLLGSNAMRALVTGAFGFVGTPPVRPPPRRGRRGHRHRPVPADGGSVLDIADPASVADALRLAEPEVVYHLAGWSDVGASWHHPVEVLRANAEGTLHLLEAGSPGRCATGAGDLERRRLRHRRRGRAARHRGPPAAAGEPVRRQQGGGRLPRPAGVARPRPGRRAGPGVQPPRSRPDRPVRRLRPSPSRIAANERDGGDEVPVGNLAARRDFTDVRDVVRAYRLLVERRRAGRGLQRLLRRGRRRPAAGRPAARRWPPGRCGW